MYKRQEHSYPGELVNRLVHSLQTATRAHRDGHDEEYVVAALLHDLGDLLSTMNHAEYAASIIKPYVRPNTCLLYTSRRASSMSPPTRIAPGRN